MILPSGLRAAWTTDGTGNVAPKSGKTVKIALPFAIKAGNAISVLNSQTDIGNTAAAGYTQLTTKVTADTNGIYINAYNDDSTMTLNTSVSILIIERKVY